MHEHDPIADQLIEQLHQAPRPPTSSELQSRLGFDNVTMSQAAIRAEERGDLAYNRVGRLIIR